MLYYSETESFEKMNYAGTAWLPITVINSIMGEKDTLDNSTDEQSSGDKWWYIPPYLDEIDRVAEVCPTLKFHNSAKDGEDRKMNIPKSMI